MLSPAGASGFVEPLCAYRPVAARGSRGEEGAHGNFGAGIKYDTQPFWHAASLRGDEYRKAELKYFNKFYAAFFTEASAII